MPFPSVPRRLCAIPLLAAAPWAAAIGVSDATGDYVPGFAGSQKGDLDVVGAFVTYNTVTDRFVFSGTMNADIGTSTGGLYVWGVNRGAGTPRFAGNGVPGVLFDSVVVFNADGSGTVTVFSPAPQPTPLPAGTAKAIGSTIIGEVAGSLLPSNGFAKADYTWNLWPRDGTLPAGFGQISDFAPNNANLPVLPVGSVPEPASVALMLAGLAAVATLRRRGTRS